MHLGDPRPPKTKLCKETMILFREASVKAHQMKVMGGVNRKCTQRMLWFSHVYMAIAEQQQKHFPEISNMADMYGPIALEAWNVLPSMTVGDEKDFWGKRRMSVEGKTLTGESGPGSEAEAAKDITEMPNVTMELPAVGEGRGTSKLRPLKALQGLLFGYFGFLGSGLVSIV